MKRLTLILTCCSVLTVGGAAADKGAPSAAISTKAVMPVARRLQALKTAERVLQEHETTWSNVSVSLPDPFYRSNFVASPVATEPAPVQDTRSGSDVLESIAQHIHPTGTMLIGSEPYLLVDGKRFKDGDSLTLTVDGLIYTVTITKIERNSYTLRLNDDELRREFK
jgi:hypothetical protein